MDILESLSRREILSHFSEDDLAELARRLSRLRLPVGANVISEGDTSSDAFLLESGCVAIQRETPYGLFSLAELTAGDFFGETCFIDGGTRSGDAKIIEQATLLSLNRKALTTPMEERRSFALAVYWTFWKSLSAKVRRSNGALSRFFNLGGEAGKARPTGNAVTTGSFRIDLAAKRKVFQEARLSAMEIHFLSTLSREKQIPSGGLIFQEGEPGERMYVVLEGRVMISKYIPGAGEEALAFLERGDFFGEMALIDNQPRSADAKAHAGPAVVLAIPREVVEGILDIRKVSSLRLLKLLCSMTAKRLRELDDKIIGWYMLAGGTIESSLGDPPTS